MCDHGAVIRSSHWSCCGVREESNHVCTNPKPGSQKTSGDEYYATKIMDLTSSSSELNHIYCKIPEQTKVVAVLNFASLVEPAKWGKLYTYQSQSKYPLDPLVGLEPRPQQLIEACDSFFECTWCKEKMCRVCRLENRPVKWHTGETCEQAKRTMAASMSVDALLIDAYSKKCPSCNSPGQHFHGHHCHHISPKESGINPQGGCPNCHVDYCYACAAYTVEDGVEIKGPPPSRQEEGSNHCAREPRHNLFCNRSDIMENIDSSSGWPIDKRCGCAICPWCKVGQPCDMCEGDCVVCQGSHPQGKAIGKLARMIVLADERESARRRGDHSSSTGETKSSVPTIEQEVVREFKIGDQVECRDRGAEAWKTGVVERLNPVRVRREGHSSAYEWAEVRHLLTATNSSARQPNGHHHHHGEWRDGRTLQRCKQDDDHNGSMWCIHPPGDVIREAHWSCCGVTTESDGMCLN